MEVQIAIGIYTGENLLLCNIARYELIQGNLCQGVLTSVWLRRTTQWPFGLKNLTLYY